MSNFRHSLKSNPVLQRLSSIKITVFCLGLLFVLTFWGTVAQINEGLFQAQERFFHSWYFLVFGFVPFPGAQLVLWVLFINLVCVASTRFVYKLTHIGIMIIHIGLLTYFVSAYLTLHGVEESNLTLREGQGSNISSDYHRWELSIWKIKKGNIREVTACDAEMFQPGVRFPVSPDGFTVTVKSYFKNAQAYTTKDPREETFINDSAIRRLTALPFQKEPEKNFPGGTFEIADKIGTRTFLLLYGKESKPTGLLVNGEEYDFMLRRKRYALPFVLSLKDFQMEVHPGTTTARSYKSLVEINNQNLMREITISMNNPLRFKEYTLYQASYAIDASGRELSTLAVVKNSARLLPYISSLLTFSGLVIHFLLMALTRNKRIKYA